MPTPLHTPQSDATIGGLKPVATPLASAGLREQWSQKIKDQSVFSARTTERSYIDYVKRQLEQVAAGTMKPDDAESRLRETLQNLGYSPQTGFPNAQGEVPPATPGSIRDLSSTRRIQLIVDTNVKQARSLGQLAASEDPATLLTYPAWKLTRTGARKKPRGDWKNRWAAAGDAVGWQGAAKTQFVALKTSPIWQAIADGKGGYEDCIGSPYPPFAFGSGMAWVGVNRTQWLNICKQEGIADGMDGIRARAKELKDAQRSGDEIKTPYSALTWPVARPSDGDGNLTPAATERGTARPGRVSGDGAAYKPDFKARLDADRAIDAALERIGRAKSAAASAEKAVADAQKRIDELKADYTDAAERIAEAEKNVAMYRQSVADRSQDIAELDGRVVNYGSSASTYPKPTDANRQRAFDMEMERLGAAAARYAKSAEGIGSAAALQGMAAAKTVERLVADVAGRAIAEMRRELTEAADGVEAYLRDRENTWLDRMNVENWWKSAKDAASSGRRSAFRRLMGFVKQKTGGES